MINFQNSKFFTTFANAACVPNDRRPQVAFAGRSNVGKSSLINSLLMRKKLAHVSATPGKTTNLNFYDIDGKIWFVDLPGYGFAKNIQANRQHWSNLMENYFANSNISLTILVIDARHEPSENDIIMANFLTQRQLPYIIVANKADKLKKSQLEPTEDYLRNIKQFNNSLDLVMYSSASFAQRTMLLDKILSYIT